MKTKPTQQYNTIYLKNAKANKKLRKFKDNNFADSNIADSDRNLKFTPMKKYTRLATSGRNLFALDLPSVSRARARAQKERFTDTFLLAVI